MAAVAVMSSASAATVAFGDFNNDGLMDMAAITSSTTVTVSLANPDGSYTVSAILKAPSNQPIGSIGVFDSNADGNLDIYCMWSVPKFSYSHVWLGKGDGTFGKRNTYKMYGSW